MQMAQSWPVDPGVLPEFLLAMALIELTPGPNMGYLAVVAASRGRIAGMLSVLGVTLGLGFYLVLAVFGLSSGPLESDLIMALLRWGGVLYLLYLALDAVRAPTTTAPTDAASGRRLIMRGLVANLLNPKALLFYAVLLPGFVRPGLAPIWVQLLILGLGHIVISLVVHLSIVFGMASGVAAWPPNWRRALRWLSAGGLVAVAAWLAISG